ncbi:hypothetical protein jhhlp_004003 [Lomentospora prolificans]|uniref:DNA recombination and repair protein Rad51-like C-terminal domain-containing protein n=1 Tax=Lomentospora prolificans TaxID=41688 RepID=A0A2N3NAC4_9PEZI|nr:hypothetical protein jhhlp_004003 [Lomentospora prolificans]
MAEENRAPAGMPDILPVSAAVLSRLERQRRNALRARGGCGVGCEEVDQHVLLGGLERGSVVGISSDEDFGLLLSFQIVARALWRAFVTGAPEKALVISTQPTGVVARILRDAIMAQARGTDGDVKGKAREVLAMASIVRVFDVKGVWEALDDLDVGETPSPFPTSPMECNTPERSQFTEADTKAIRDEIPDSDEEVSLSPSPPPAPAAPAAEPMQKESKPGLCKPDLILITHFSTLLTTLFTHTEKNTAHTSLQLLSSHLRHLARSMSSSPLILITNAITTSSSGPAPAAASLETGPLFHDSSSARHRSRQVDPTLRSIFNTPGPYQTNRSSGKPSFGLVFAQFLDLHLLCTKIPRTREDAEAMAMGRSGEQVWVVEGLLDEQGVWDGRKGPRKGRERRWGVVDWVSGMVVDAFEGER